MSIIIRGSCFFTYIARGLVASRPHRATPRSRLRGLLVSGRPAHGRESCFTISHHDLALPHGEQRRCPTNNRICTTGCTDIPMFWSMMYIIPVLHDVYYSCYAWCTLFLFGMMYIIPVWHDACYSCLAWCILFLSCMMYIIPVLPDGPYSRLPSCTVFCCTRPDLAKSFPEP